MTIRKVFFFWLPLSLAWLLMTVEGPWIQAIISRKSDAETQLAAFGLVFSLSVLIETPVIMLLATGSALARDRQSFRTLWRFMMLINGFVLVVALLMAFTPLLDVYLEGLLGVPRHIVAAARPGMQIMTLWGAFIGYRRFHQGIIIRFGKTHFVGKGTVLRTIVSGGVALTFGLISDMPGAEIGAMALVLAVAVEAVYTWKVSRPDVRRLLSTPGDPRNQLTMGDAMRFHLPLALTSLITLGINPVLERGLASMPDATQSLAAFPIVFAILLMTRSGGMAYQEVVIALDDSEASHRVLTRFTWLMGAASSLFMLLFVFTPLIDVYTGVILNAPQNLIPLALMGAQAAIFIPLLTTLQSYLRALLMLSRKTGAIYRAIVISFVATTALVWGGIAVGMHGILAASVGLTAGMLIELAYLYVAYRREKAALARHWRLAVAAAGV